MKLTLIVPLASGLLAAALWGTADIRRGDAALVLSDSFNYADSTALRAVWTSSSGSQPNYATDFAFAASTSGGMSADPALRPPTIAGQAMMTLPNNSGVYRDLGTTITTDFTVTALVGVNGYSRTLQFGLTDGAGGGYAMRWTGGSFNPLQYMGNGQFSLREIDGTGWTAYNAGPQIGVAVDGVSPPTRYPFPANPLSGGTLDYTGTTVNDFLGFSELKLTWSADAGLLSAYQDGQLLTSTTDASIASFSRLYLGGHATAFIDSVTVEAAAIPEAGAGLLAAMAFATTLATQRRWRRGA